MSGRANQIDQIAAMTSIVEVAPHAAAVKVHLRSIIGSSAFKGSRRSQEFLQFVVERALGRHFDDLKERILGVELFGRDPSYDTGDDAIVRVTACDVRKRLHQFYAELGHPAEFRIEIPTGSYIPEIHNLAPPPALPLAAIGNEVEIVAPAVHSPDPVTAERGNHIPYVAVGVAGSGARRAAWAAIAMVAVLAVACAFWLSKRRPAADAGAPAHVLPWSAMIQPNRPIRLIFCDPEIVNVQRLLNYSVTLSDYANQRYWPTDMRPDVRRIFQAISFRGASMAAVDVSITLTIDGMLHTSTKRALQMQTARSVRLGDFKTEDSFVLFGSPRSNPWVELFQDQLDFVFDFDNVRKAEFVRNKHPRNRESPIYVPSAVGWETGYAYAILALVANPEQNGNVLLLAGSNAEATEAAGKLAVNLGALAKILGSAGIDAHGPVKRFEILLRVSTMAGSPNTSEVVACHVLNGRS
jgi:hypothetical protein